MHIPLAVFCFVLAARNYGHAATTGTKADQKRPNIVYIIADDLGFNDVSFRGSNQIPTPNIDALAYSGVILDRHYVLPTCTPSRAAILTAMYPIRTGMQGYPLKAGEPRALPLSLRTLPQHLSKLGYRTNLVGKWHQGFYTSAHLPTRRGFHHHLGYWNGYVSYYGYNATLDVPDGIINNRRGFDLHWDEKPAWSLNGQYATHTFTDHAEKIIMEHDEKAGPLYLQLAHLATHAGLNGTLLELPDEEANDARFPYIDHRQRRQLAGIIRELDISVGRVVAALDRSGMLNNTIILFTTDNGGETTGMHQNFGSNWPLRGQKWTLYEGGVRGVAAVWTPWLARPNTVHMDLVHVSDWLPTFYQAAGGNLSDLGNIDGVSQWEALTGTPAQEVRSEVLVNIDVNGAIIQGDWKLIKGEHYPDMSQLLGEDGRGSEVPAYDSDAVAQSTTATALAAASNKQPVTTVQIKSLRRQASISQFCRPQGADKLPTKCEPYCLFNLQEDPCEVNDVSKENPGKAEELAQRLSYWDSQKVPQLNKDTDLRADPLKHNGTWVPWLDSETEQTSGTNTRAAALFLIAVVCALSIGAIKA